MRKRIWILQILIMAECYLVFARAATGEEKAEAAIPITTSSPPEGNTTFLDGTTWCVARPGVPQSDLQNALDWACGLGMADCGPIQNGGECYEPTTLLSHASFAFNSYYQQNGNSDIACNFGGTATLTKRNPSYGKCVYSTSESLRSSSESPMSKYKPGLVWWEITGILLLVFFRLSHPWYSDCIWILDSEAFFYQGMTIQSSDTVFVPFGQGPTSTRKPSASPQSTAKISFFICGNDSDDVGQKNGSKGGNGGWSAHADPYLIFVDSLPITRLSTILISIIKFFGPPTDPSLILRFLDSSSSLEILSISIFKSSSSIDGCCYC